MGRVLAIDYGKKRVGIAVSDPLKIIAQPLTTINSSDCLAFLRDYISAEEVERVVIGMPTQADGSPSDSQRYIRPFIGRFRKEFPDMAIEEVDEYGTSVEAMEAMIEGGVKMMKRRQSAGIVDKTAASIILSRFLEQERI